MPSNRDHNVDGTGLTRGGAQKITLGALLSGQVPWATREPLENMLK
jgi:hypothetical protein